MPSTGYYINKWDDLGSGVYQAFYTPEHPSATITNWNAVITVSDKTELVCMLNFGGSMFYTKQFATGLNEAKIAAETVIRNTFNLPALPPAGTMTAQESADRLQRWSQAVTLYKACMAKSFRRITPPLINDFTDPSYVWVPKDYAGNVIKL